MSKSAACGKIALAVLPGPPPLALLLNTALLIVVLWVVGTALAVQFVLQAAFGTDVGSEFFTEREQLCLTFLWHNSDGGRTGVKPYYVCSNGVLWFLVGPAF